MSDEIRWPRQLTVSTAQDLAAARSVTASALAPGVGHVPMFDDPGLVAAVIRATIEQPLIPTFGGTA